MISNRIFPLLGLLLLFMWPQWGLASAGPEVIVQRAMLEKLSSRVEALGTLQANESIRVSPQVTRTVTRLNFEDGQRVTKGTVLVEMTSSEDLAVMGEARMTADVARQQKERVGARGRLGAVFEAIVEERVGESGGGQARRNGVR